MSRLRARLRWARRLPGRFPSWWRRFKRNGYRRERCDHCGLPFRWRRDPRHSYGHGDGKVWHGPCMAYIGWRRRAEERLRVVGVMAEMSGLTASDVRDAMGLRASSQPGPGLAGMTGSDAWNVAWRVFYDLEKTVQDPEQGTTEEAVG